MHFCSVWLICCPCSTHVIGKVSTPDSVMSNEPMQSLDRNAWPIAARPQIPSPNMLGGLLAVDEERRTLDNTTTSPVPLPPLGASNRSSTHRDKFSLSLSLYKQPAEHPPPGSITDGSSGLLMVMGGPSTDFDAYGSSVMSSGGGGGGGSRSSTAAISSSVRARSEATDRSSGGSEGRPHRNQQQPAQRPHRLGSTSGSLANPEGGSEPLIRFRSVLRCSRY